MNSTIIIFNLSVLSFLPLDFVLTQSMCTLPDYKVRFFLGVQGSQSLVITLPNKSNLQQCQNYRTISLISHPSKVMLKILLNRLKPKAEIIAEEQAGFRAGRNTTEQIFSLRILYEKYLQHQQDLYYIFIHFKTIFDRVWHAAMWTTMKRYNINTNLIRVTKHLYDKATSAVFLNGSIGDRLRTLLESDRDVYSHPPFSTYCRQYCVVL